MRKKERAASASKKWWGTGLLVGINVMVFLLMRALPGAEEQLTMNPSVPGITERPWTLVTVFFTHGELVHLLVNMGILWVFGRILEGLTDARTVVLLYVAGGFLGSLATPFLAPLIQWTGPVVGASAATFGLVGALGALRPKLRLYEGDSKRMKSLFGITARASAFLLFAVNLLLFAMNPSVSIGAAAHGVGILTGAGIGVLLKRREILLQS